jgi:hypothetical protein
MLELHCACGFAPFWSVCAYGGFFYYALWPWDYYYYDPFWAYDGYDDISNGQNSGPIQPR